VVTQINHCTKCKPGAESTLKQGLSLGDPNVFKDEGWGFGYGNFVVVRYDNSLLPASTKQRLVARNMPNAHVFVMYAHLASFSVQNGQQLTAGQQIGGCGNTGNSEAFIWKCVSATMRMHVGRPCATTASIRRCCFCASGYFAPLQISRGVLFVLKRKQLLSGMQAKQPHALFWFQVVWVRRPIIIIIIMKKSQQAPFRFYVYVRATLRAI
jgi:hypothetical protein